MLGLVIDGNFSPTARDVDDWIERKGSIEQAFDGVRGEEGADARMHKVNGMCITQKVAFGIWSAGNHSWLVVVDRHNPSHSAGFFSNSDRMLFLLHGRRDSVYCEHVNIIRRAIENSEANERVRPETAVPSHLELAAVSRQAVQSDFECMRTETAHSVQRVQMQGMMWGVAAIVFACLAVGGFAYAGSCLFSTMLNEVRQVNNRTENNRVQITVLQDQYVGVRNELEDQGREIRIHARRISDMEDRTRPQLAIEGPPNKTLGNEVGVERQPKEGSVFDQFIHAIGYLVFILVVVLIIIKCIAKWYQADQMELIKRE
jgi:hypothetical protein